MNGIIVALFFSYECMVLDRGPRGGAPSDFGTFSEMMKGGQVVF